MTNNFWLGNNELAIIYKDGTYYVVEKYENWNMVFSGHYKQCVQYCENRVIDYEESIVGMEMNKIRIKVLKGALKGYKYNAKITSNGFYECNTEFGLICYTKDEIEIL